MGTLFVKTSRLAKMLLSPEKHVFLCALVVVLWIWFRSRPGGARKQAWAVAGPLCLAWIIVLFSPLGSIGLYHYERSVPAPSLRSLKDRTALVLAGNTVLFDTSASRMIWYVDSARIQEALRLYRQGVLKKLVITGGQASKLPRRFLGEAASVALWWREMGVPADSIAIEDQSRNTHENFTYSIPLLPKNEEIILITSGYQMPRALGVARKAGLSRVIAYPVDYKVNGPIAWWSWTNLENARRLIFECVGRAVYRLSGFSE